METQAPRPRPLFRLPTILARPTAPVDPIPNPAPAPEPRPPMVRPASIIRPLAGTFQQPQSQEPTPQPSAVVSPAAIGAASVPAIGATLPVATTSLVPSSPTPRASETLPTSPAKPALPSSTVPIVTSVSSVQSSPIAKVLGASSSAATSITPKAAASSSSVPTSLAAQMEVQQKDVVVRIKTIGKEEVSKENETKETAKSSCKNILTIAGENKGAFMKLIQSSKKHHEVVHKNENPKTKSHGNDWESSTTSSDEAVGNVEKNKGHKGKVTSSMPTRAFVNSNVQSINNSILYNCSCTHHDPGVHLALSRN